MDIDHLYLSRYNYNLKVHPIYKTKVGKLKTTFEKYSNEYYQNQLLDCLMTLLKDTDNSINSLYKPIDNDTELAKKIADQIPELNSTKDDPYNFGSLHEQVIRRNDYITGKKGIGPFALNVTNLILTMLYGVGFRDSDFVKGVGLGSLGLIIDDNDDYISSWLSGFINAHVDIVKDPWISKLNVNQYTYNMLNLLIRSGWGDSALWFLSQPIIRSMANADILSRSQYARSSDQTKSLYITRLEAIANALKLFMPEDDFSEEVLLNILLSKNADLQISIVNWVKENTRVLEEFAKNPESKTIVVDGVYYDRKFVQSQVFYAWKILEKYAATLGDFVQHTKIDTRKHGNSLIAIAKYRNEYMDLVYPRFEYSSLLNIPSLQTMVKHSWIDFKTKSAIAAPFTVLNGLTFAGNEAFIQAVINFGKILTDSNSKPNINLLKTIASNLITAIKSYYFVRYVENELCRDGETASQHIRSLFVGPWTMNKRLNSLLYQIETNPKYKYLANNTFIKQIQADLQENDVLVNGNVVNVPLFIKILDNVDNSKLNADMLTDGWEDLLSDPDINVQNFAKDMIVYAFMSSGEFKGWNKMFKYVPFSFLQGQFNTNTESYVDFIRKALKKSIFPETMLDDIVVNNFMDYQISKRVPLVDNEDNNNFIQVGDIILIGKPVKDTNDVRKYITVKKNKNAGTNTAKYNVYKCIGYVDAGNKYAPIYVMMKKRGYHGLNNKDIYEYGWDFNYGENQSTDQAFELTNSRFALSQLLKIFEVDPITTKSLDYITKLYYDYGYEYEEEYDKSLDSYIEEDIIDNMENLTDTQALLNEVRENNTASEEENRSDDYNQQC